jgi:putative flippase GtrA
MKERKSETKINFDLKYLASAAIALIISFLVSATLIQSFTFPVNETSMLLVFSSAALQGWGSTDLFSKLGIDWREKTE